MKSGPTRDAARDGVQHAEDKLSVELEALGHDPGRAVAPEHRREERDDEADPNDRRQPVDGQEEESDHPNPPRRRVAQVEGLVAREPLPVAQVELVVARPREAHGKLKLYGEEDESTLRAAGNYAMTLLRQKRFEEAKRLLRKVTPVARRVLGNEHELSLSICEDLCRATLNGESSAEEKREALRMLEDVAGTMRRVLGPAHPDTLHAQGKLEIYRTQFPGPTA